MEERGRGWTPKRIKEYMEGNTGDGQVKHEEEEEEEVVGEGLLADCSHLSDE